MGVMVGVRAKLRRLLGKAGSDSDAGPLFNPQESAAARIEDWPAGRTLRNLAQLRAGCQDKWSFGGPKCLALKRLVKSAARRGKVIVVVLPLSPPCEHEFVNAEATRQFEELVADLKKMSPDTEWVRLDQMPELRSKRYYWHLVHLNVDGQAIATQALLDRLKGLVMHR